jgi:hypothetical protein
VTKTSVATTTSTEAVPFTERARQLATKVEWEGFAEPIPQVFTLLPRVDGETFALDLLAADDPDAAQVRDSQSVASQTIVGKPITVRDVHVAPGTAGGTWGCFLLLDVVDEDGQAFTVNTSAPQAMVRIARAVLEDGLPFAGTFVHIREAKAGQSAPIGFVVDRPL